MDSWRRRQKIRNTTSGGGGGRAGTGGAGGVGGGHGLYRSRVPLMNRDTIRTISEFISTSCENPLIGSTSITMNKLGEIYFLCENHEIRYLSAGPVGGSDLMSEGNDTTTLLRISNQDSLNEIDLSHLEFNYSSTALFIGGSHCVGIISIHDLLADQHDSYKFIVQHQCLPGDLILKVRWHPFSDTHLVLLLQSQKILVIDICCPSKPTIIPLNSARDYISFTFGPSVDWLRFTLFVLDSTGDISYITPVIPFGAVVSSEAIQELKEWNQREIDHFRDFPSPQGESELENSFNNLHLYLRAAFGSGFDQFSEPEEPLSPAQSNNWESESESSPRRSNSSKSFHRAGVAKNGGEHPAGTLFHKAFNQVPQLQGPLVIEDRIIGFARSREVIPCDICVLEGSGYNSIPLILIVWSDGNIEELLLAGQIGPKWKSEGLLNPSFPIFGVESPSLVHMETLSLTVSQDLTATESKGALVTIPFDEYSIIPDPILGHNLHLVGRSTGVSYMIHLQWLERDFGPTTTQQNPSQSSESLSSIGESSRRTTGWDERDSSQSSAPSIVLITCDGNQSQHTPLLVKPSTALIEKRNVTNRGITGFFVCPDPTEGHIALVRYSDGYLAAVNVTIQKKLLQLEGRIQARHLDLDTSTPSSVSLSTTLQLTGLPSNDNIIEQKDYSLQFISQKILRKALIGLETIPFMSDQGGNRQAPTSECYESLLNAKQHIDQEVILPLQQLQQRTKFHEQIIRDLYEGQATLITGPSKGIEAEKGIIGLEKRLEVIQAKQNDYKKRLEQINCKLIQQKNLAASALATSQATRTKISRAEKVYSLQLQNWQDSSHRIEQAIKTLAATRQYLGQDKDRDGAATSVKQRRGNTGTFSIDREKKTEDFFILSKVEEDKCEQLLGVQGEALKVTNDATLELEQRLNSLN